MQKATQQDVPVLSYDRLILGTPDVAVYVSFDNVRVGELQAESLSEKLKEDGSPKGPIVKINGDPADSNAALFKEGSNKGFDAAGVEIAKEYDTPEWSATNAQNEMQQAITALGKDGFAGVYAANDDTGGGAIAAMQIGRDRSGRTAHHRPGRDGRRSAADPRRPAVHDDLQGLSNREASISAEIAVDLAEGKEVPQGKVTDELDNEAGKVPSILFEPVAVTKDNIKQTVIADEAVTARRTLHRAVRRKPAKKRASPSGWSDDL